MPRNPEQERQNIFQEINSKYPKLARIISRVMLGLILLAPGVGVAAQEGGDTGTNNNDTVALVTPETAEQLNSITVNITSNVNVRRINSENFGNVDPTFPRGNTEIIGYFNDGPLQGILEGTWLVTFDGQHAVHASVVGVDDSEISTLVELTYNGTNYVLIIPEVVSTPAADAVPVAPTDSPDDDNPDASGTEQPTNLLEIHEGLPESFSVEVITDIFENITQEFEVEINRDSLLEFPLGQVEISDNPAVQELADAVLFRYPDFNPAAVSAIYVGQFTEPTGAVSTIFAVPVTGTNFQEWRPIVLTPYNNSGFFGMPNGGTATLLGVAENINETGMTNDSNSQFLTFGDQVIAIYDQEEQGAACNNLPTPEAIDNIMDGDSCEIVIPNTPFDGNDGFVWANLGGLLYEGE
jgi:hypothetical protein